ncbi:MAG: ISNCY family transposase [Nitrososphaerota archaeon]|jgi:transposase|nr:ISNCY family transposase [Nitrososphaerota archaeon]
MKILSHKSAQELLEVLEETKNTYFKDKHNTYPYTQWEQKRVQIKERLNKLPKYIRQAVETINHEEQKTGRPPKLDLEKKVNLFIFVRLINKSNRQAEESLQYLQPFFDVELSYKYIERLYSDPEIKLVLHNVFVLPLKDESVSGELAGDGTGYAVSVENHYRSSPEKHGKKFVHFFSLIDLATGLYVGCGMSHVSEMEAFKRAVSMLRRIGASIKSVRLDKYFSSRKVIKMFGRSVSLFLIPKANQRKVGVWRDILTKIITSPFDFLTQYFKRNLSESGFSADKDRFGRNIKQKRDDRQQTTLFTNALFHNIYTTRTNTK